MALRKHSTKRKVIFYLLVLVWNLLPSNAMPVVMAADKTTVAVVFPDIREPYRSVFAQIIQGIRKQAGIKVETYTLREDWDVNHLQAWLEKEDCNAIITLGTRGLKAGRSLDSGIPIVAGAVLLSPGSNEEGLSGISLTPDPKKLFSQLKSLQPKIKRVTVIYHPKRNSSLIDLAQVAANAQGIKLIAIKADNLRTAANIYKDILASAAGDTDAIWLPQDPATVDNKIILPLILQQAWNKNLIVFSSNPSHIKRGVLFALYPNNVAMGTSLATLAQRKINSQQNNKSIIVPLNDLSIGVNLRTADHIGLKINKQQRRNFDLTFPAP